MSDTSPTGRPYLRSAEWGVRKIPHRDALVFLEKNHYARGGANTSVAAHGLFHGEELWGVALWMPPLPNAQRKAAERVRERTGRVYDWRGVLVLSRLAVSPGAPANATGFLLAASMRLLDRSRWPILLTYADNALGHVGVVYRATNWIDDGDVPAGDTWVHSVTGEQRGRRRGPKVLSVEQMRDLGYVRRPKNTKRRYLHVRRNT